MSAHDILSKERTVDVEIQENHAFQTMLFKTPVLKGLKKAGFKRPSPIQLCAIPLARIGLDLIVQAKSGTGKTLVFAITILEALQIRIKRPQALVLAPTREIALQIADVITEVGSAFEGLNVGTFIGGLPLEIDRGNAHCHVAVGAPGRIRHLIDEKILDISAVRIFVLDEADKILQDSYQKDINYIFNSLNKSKQILACSATYTEDLITFVNKYMRSGTHVTPDSVPTPVLIGLKQFAYMLSYHRDDLVKLRRKQKALLQIFQKVKYDQCLVFTNYITRADALMGILSKAGQPVACLTGKQPQEERIESLRKLKSHEVRILVTTDLAARGIDASSVNLVINFDAPKDQATYLHRMGRAGRYGAHGLCITLIINEEEQAEFTQMLGSIQVSVLYDTHFFNELWDKPIEDFEKLTPILNLDDEKNDDSERSSIEEVSDEEVLKINRSLEGLSLKSWSECSVITIPSESDLSDKPKLQTQTQIISDVSDFEKDSSQYSHDHESFENVEQYELIYDEIHQNTSEYILQPHNHTKWFYALTNEINDYIKLSRSFRISYE